MITTQTDNLPLSMKEGSASYFCFVCLFVYPPGDMLRGRLRKRLVLSGLRSRFRFTHIVGGVF